MPAAKKKKKKTAKKSGTTKTGTRYENAMCKGDCRLRTKGMKVGDTRRRIGPNGEKLKLIRVG